MRIKSNRLWHSWQSWKNARIRVTAKVQVKRLPQPFPGSSSFRNRNLNHRNRLQAIESNIRWLVQLQRIRDNNRILTSKNRITFKDLLQRTIIILAALHSLGLILWTRRTVVMTTMITKRMKIKIRMIWTILKKQTRSIVQLWMMVLHAILKRLCNMETLPIEQVMA